MLGRAVVNKHRAYAFYRPSALWIAQIFVDQAFAVSQIMLFSLIVYFTTNLYRSAGAFFIYFLMILSGNVSPLRILVLPLRERLQCLAPTTQR